ncbi:hydrogenase maturation protease [Nonomuraea ferruginea]
MPLFKLCVRVENVGREPSPEASRDEALRHALIACHTLLAVPGGRFVSLLEPPAWAEIAARDCANAHTYPVLSGDQVMLSSPILLYDNPRVAPESPGDLHDAAEIDEILSLRTLTLTDAEKQEARATDPRAAAILDRVESMTPDDLARLHGTTRDPRPEGTGVESQVPWWDPEADASVRPETDCVEVGGVPVRKGSRVRLRPRLRGTDPQDMFLDGRTALVEAVLLDVDGSRHFAVTLEDDPAAELNQWYGRYRYFAPRRDRAAGPGGAGMKRVLVAGIGNVFLGDDGFGVEVVRRMDPAALPGSVVVADYGIRGVHLAYELLGGTYDTLIMVDAVEVEGPPGTVAVLEIDDEPAPDAPPPVDGHGMHPQAVLDLLRKLGGGVGRVLLVGCRPQVIDEVMGLSEPVAAAVDGAVAAVTALARDEAARPEATRQDKERADA